MHSGIIRMIRFLKMKNRKALIQSNLFLYSMHTSSLKCPSSSLCSNVLNGRAPHRSILLHPWGKSFSSRNFSWLSLKCFLLSSIHLPWFCFLPNKRDTTASCVSGAPRPSTRALICYRDSQTQHAAALLPTTLDTSEQVQSKSSTGTKAHGEKPGGNQGQASQGSPSAPPATRCPNICEMLPTRGAPWRLSAWLTPTLQTPRRKAGDGQKPHSLYTQFRHRKPFLSGSGGNPFKVQVPKMPAKGQPCKEAL